MIQKKVKKKLMGTAFSLGIIAQSEDEADFWLHEGIIKIQKIEALFSEYQTTSLTSKVNDAPANQSIKLNNEVFQLIKRSQDISKLTNGCFDITARKLKNLYTFKNKEAIFPNREQIKEALQSVGYKNLSLNVDNLSIKKAKPNMGISFNAIAKGYAADTVKKLWKNNNIQSGFIDASGDLCVFGQKLDGTSWKVAIANPNDITKPLLYIPLKNQAIATSGDSVHYFTHKGKKFSHNINPLTGKPLEGLKSVSIISPSAELSDALSTAVYVMGKKKGLDFVNQLPSTFAIIIDLNNNLSISKNLKYEKFNS